MAEWHVTPDHIVANWTPELLALMVEKLNARLERRARAASDDPPPGPAQPTMSDTEFFQMAGIKVVKRGD